MNNLKHTAYFTHSCKTAFTLAEVLITLGIIGIVAALTLPTVIATYQEKANITALKKAVSELAQINEQLNAEYELLTF